MCDITSQAAQQLEMGFFMAEATSPGASGAPPTPSPETLRKVGAIRSQVRETFGKVVMAMMMLPRYRSQTVGDLQHLVLEPLIRDRIAVAYPGKQGDEVLTDLTGLAIWASVSESVDAGIREQIKAGVFPVRLKSEDWASGDINWLLDVIAPDKRATASVIANFRQVVKQGSLRLHPIITRLVDAETLEKMGAEKIGEAGKTER
jgi:hemolysin-activating ACP:hemolysin acyltransferase